MDESRVFGLMSVFLLLFVAFSSATAPALTTAKPTTKPTTPPPVHKRMFYLLVSSFLVYISITLL